ncbi:MAG: HigA family addiction module antitoxin [Rhodospirillaceae bacterium]|nr:HigA family addiction module antitoxin [Rhodospirillaceae bacterium]
MTRLDPVHPGEVLKRDFMGPFGLSATALAKAIGVTPARVNEIVRGRRGIAAETALRLARYFGTDARSWMNLQDRYDLELAARGKAEAGRNLLRATVKERRFRRKSRRTPIDPG